jgi:hypothetical protein
MDKTKIMAFKGIHLVRSKIERQLNIRTSETI